MALPSFSSANSLAKGSSHYNYCTSSFSSSSLYSSSYNLVHSQLILAVRSPVRIRSTLQIINGSIQHSSPRNMVALEPTKPIEEVRERTRRTLQRESDPTAAMKLIDTLQWLGISYHYEEDIDLWLEKLQHWDVGEDDLQGTALRFRLLRQNARPVSSDVFRKFMVKEQNKEGLLSLYEASYLGANGEDTLSDAMKFAKNELKSSPVPQNISRRVARALELPRHLRMERLESRLYINEYHYQDNHCPILLKHAIVDYNEVQLLHQTELAELSRWWNHLGLIESLGFARDRLIECFLWTVGILPDPKYSHVRVEVAKSLALLTVIDDVFDMFAPMNELHLFTQAIQRWNLDMIEQLPEYMKVCYMALYNTTNEIAFKVLKEQKRNILPFLAKVWIDTIEGYLIEAEWFKNGSVPSAEDYLRNGVATSGSYMALVNIFFLMGEGLTTQNVKLMAKPYPKLFSNSGTILRLWDDLGTTKEEQDLGDNSSIITSLMKYRRSENEGEAKDYVMELIRSLWKDMNGELLESNLLPLPMSKACFNMSRTSQVVYQHKEDSYFSSVKKVVNFLLFEQIDN
ncbi:monoterpene synthase TPS4, chloroplastic-like isoform X2 [Andrographis paniculata]|uniref:monoterpene synthase TPS4, chloroplastic-like isoform X2 n=1 Tax=Andrographis paniculata TaxID=175694 RepID=UPI0021E986F4|nr:monoterpene synthase TPS4, chloroplastic-like isoform X2 [Andrographis paniculata]